MAKKINSEYLIKTDESFNIKIGTSDKKNPEVIYVILSSYIIPLNDDVNEETIVEFEKTLRKYLKNLLIKNNFCTKDIIVVVDAAVNRMSYGKQTFLEIQIYFKPSEISLLKYNKNFKNISDLIYKNYIIDIINFTKANLTSEQISMSKIKRKTIYREI